MLGCQKVLSRPYLNSTLYGMFLIGHHWTLSPEPLEWGSYTLFWFVSKSDNTSLREKCLENNIQRCFFFFLPTRLTPCLLSFFFYLKDLYTDTWCTPIYLIFHPLVLCLLLTNIGLKLLLNSTGDNGINLSLNTVQSIGMVE